MNDILHRLIPFLTKVCNWIHFVGRILHCCLPGHQCDANIPVSQDSVVKEEDLDDQESN